jgi:hypothetical protein
MGDLNALDFYPVICLSASKYLGDHASLDRAGGFDYIQGAGKRMTCSISVDFEVQN